MAKENPMKRSRRRARRRLAAEIALGLIVPGDHIEMMNLHKMQAGWLQKAQTLPWLQRRLAGKNPRFYSAY